MSSINKGFFDEAFATVLKIEKGYVNSKFDNGGETKFGISKRTYPELDIANLTLEKAKDIYFYDFWNCDLLKLSNIPDKEIAIELFDTSVNMGQDDAGMFLQTALNHMNRNNRIYKDLLVDGHIGPVTLFALEIVLKRGEKQKLLKALNGEQFRKYVKIIEKYPEQEMNFVGWLERV
jgi:lysozyme family protein